MALVVYDRARLAYKQGENVTEQQQVARVAFDVLTSDIRMAGFNTDPDGDRGRPDEQLEAAFATAITVRADYDADDSIEVDLPEQALAGTGSAYGTVSTGNDEIVSYVLAKPDGSSSETLAFNADVGDTVRDGSIEAVSIGRVDLSQSDPPYTLYKLVLENDPSGCCGTSFSRRMPVVDNVRSLRFRYFDRAGVELAPPGGDETALAVATRAAVRRIGVEIEALTRDADPHWLDADDADPDTRQFRKFRLDGEIAPPNLGRGAIPDLQADLTPPGAPATPRLYPGHCGGLVVHWPPNPGHDGVAYYRVAYGTDSSALEQMQSSLLPGAYVEGLTDDTPYYFSLQAVDAAGNVSPLGPTDLVTTANTNTPASVASLNATGTTGQIDLDWTATGENTGSTGGDPASPAIRDLAGYRVYRSQNPGFTPSSSNRIADENDIPDLPVPIYSDMQAPRCVPHYYKVTAVDACGIEGSPSDEAAAQSWGDVDPMAPDGVQAHYDTASGVRIRWSAVYDDVNGDAAHIDTYKIYRSALQDSSSPEPLTYTFLEQVANVTEYTDPITIPTGQTAYFKVQAVDRCLPPNESAPSIAAAPSCAFSGRVMIRQPSATEDVSGSESVSVEVDYADPGAVHTEARVTWEKGSDGSTWTKVLGSGGTSWTWNWIATPSGTPLGYFEPGHYLITAEVDQTFSGQDCTGVDTVRVEVRE